MLFSSTLCLVAISGFIPNTIVRKESIQKFQKFLFSSFPSLRCMRFQKIRFRTYPYQPLLFFLRQPVIGEMILLAIVRAIVPASNHAQHAGLSSVPVLLRPCCSPLSIVHHRETNSSVFISESIRAFRPRSLFFHRSPLKNFVSRNSIGTNKCPP